MRGTSSVAHSLAAKNRSQSGAVSRIISEQIVDDSRGWFSERHISASGSFIRSSAPHEAARSQRLLVRS